MDQVERRSDLIDTTDCLEAISVFKSVKNLLFTIAIICMLILQIVFWANRFGYIDKSGCPCKLAVPGCVSQSASAAAGVCPLQAAAAVAPAASDDAPAALEEADTPDSPDGTCPLQAAPDAIAATDEAAVPGVDESDKVESKQLSACQVACPFAKAAGPGPCPKWSLGKLDKHLPACNCVAWVVSICNFLLILSATLYCLALLMSVKISLAGRLGGLAHISRAFFRSLFVLVLLIPWQVMVPGVLVGATYTPKEMLCVPVPSGDIVTMAMFYMRFCGLWLLVFLLLCMAQSRSAKWSRATLKRLGIH